ncbi:MAG: insulinase family protein [Deltaproteobacteria bacterium]|nr:insulinase family protein [Deltaproteobacteria bacterium]
MRSILLPVTFAGLVVLAAGGLARADVPPADASAPRLTVERYQLDNGLEVILHPDPAVPLVAVDLWYHVGSGDETPGKSGYAHLFEHMMFQGSANTGEDVHFSTLRKIGASTVNGTTNTDRTNYFEVVPAHQLETALRLESDRMGYLLPVLTQKSLDNQRDVVRNERRQRYDSVPYGLDRFATAAALYPEGHPYRYLTIGRHEDLAVASVDDVKAFFKTWYVPANATLILAGDFDPTAARALVAKWFAGFPRSVKPLRRDVPMPSVKASRQVLDDPFARLRRVHYVWQSARIFTPGDAELDLLSSILARPGTGRLYQLLVHEKQLAQSVDAWQASAQLASTFNIVVDLKSDAEQAEVERLLDAEIERVRTEVVTPRELTRAVTQIEASFIWGLETVMARAEVLQRYNHYLGRPDAIADDLTRYRVARPTDLLKVAARTLQRDKRVEIISIPAPAAMPAGGGK